jgi:hypothetical protein
MTNICRSYCILHSSMLLLFSPYYYFWRSSVKQCSPNRSQILPANHKDLVRLAGIEIQTKSWHFRSVSESDAWVEHEPRQIKATTDLHERSLHPPKNARFFTVHVRSWVKIQQMYKCRTASHTLGTLVSGSWECLSVNEIRQSGRFPYVACFSSSGPLVHKYSSTEKCRPV